MRRRRSIKWVDALLADGSYSALLKVVDAYRVPPVYDTSLSDFGLPPFAFVLTETIEWAAATLRSGVVTYHEAAPVVRQKAMLRSLKSMKLKDVAKWYELGLRDWKNERTQDKIDAWVVRNFDSVIRCLHLLARGNRDAILALTA